MNGGMTSSNFSDGTSWSNGNTEGGASNSGSGSWGSDSNRDRGPVKESLDSDPIQITTTMTKKLNISSFMKKKKTINKILGQVRHSLSFQPHMGHLRSQAVCTMQV